MPIIHEPVDYDPFATETDVVAPATPAVSPREDRVKLARPKYDPFDPKNKPTVIHEPVDYDPFAEIDWEPFQETTAGDYSRSLAIGLNKFGQTIGRGIDVVGNLDPTRLVTDSGEGVIDRAGQGIESFYKKKEQEDHEALSPAMKNAEQLKYTKDTDKPWTEAPVENFKSLFAGDAWKSPQKVAGSLLQSAPSSIVGGGSGMAITKGLIKIGTSAGLAGVIGGFIGEGGVAAAESGKDVYDMVINAPQAVLSQTDEYQKAWNGLSSEGLSDLAKDRQARELVADHAAMKSMAVVFGATGVLGSVSGHYMGNLIDGKASGGLVRKALTAGGTEALQETPQSGFEIFESNIQKKKYVNPDQNIWEGVKEGSIEGGVQGFAMGAGMGAGGHVIGKITKNTKQNLLDDNKGFNGENIDDIDDIGGDVPFAESADNPNTDLGPMNPSPAPEGSAGPTAEEAQWEKDIQAQRDGTYKAPVEPTAIDARKSRQRAIGRLDEDVFQNTDEYSTIESKALEAANSPGVPVNQGQDVIDRNIEAFRRAKQQEQESEYIRGMYQNKNTRAEQVKGDTDEALARFEARQQTAMGGSNQEVPILEGSKSQQEDPRIIKPRLNRYEQLVERLGGKVKPPLGLNGKPNVGEYGEKLTALRGPSQDQVGTESGAELDSMPGTMSAPSEAPGQEQTPPAPAPAMAGYSPPAQPVQVQQPKTPEAKAIEKEIKAEVKKVDTAPTDAQKHAGNYRKAHIKVQGFDISIENPDGSTRSGVDNDGNAWTSRMHGHYGYLKKTLGNDGDHVDVVVAPGATDSPKIFVVDQVDPETFELDEHKVMFGVNSKEEAEALYLSNYPEGWEGNGGITEMAPDEFKAWVKDEAQTKKPLYKEQQPVQTIPDVMATPEASPTQETSAPEVPTEVLADYQGIEPTVEPQDPKAEKETLLKEAKYLLTYRGADMQHIKKRLTPAIAQSHIGDNSHLRNAVEDAKGVISLRRPTFVANYQKTEEETKQIKTNKPVTLKDHFKSVLSSGHNFKNILEARKMANEVTGKSSEAGSVETKHIDESIESAAVEVAREIIKKGGTRAEVFDNLVGLQDRMPSLNVRTSTSIQNQAYSTPLSLAYLASELAGITETATVYEPSAGNGALVIGANPKQVTVNELNPDRVANLKTQGFKEVINVDGTQNVLEKTQDIIIANPPFGTVKDEAGKSKEWTITPNYTTTQIDHAMVFESLKSMKDTGKAVFIIGSVSDKNKSIQGRQLMYRTPDKVRFFKTLYDKYNVVDHFSVAGKLYSKQGAAWPVDVIVIHGKGKSSMTLPGATPPVLIETVDDLKGKLNGTVKENNQEVSGMGSGRTERGTTDGGSDLGARGRSGDGLQNAPVSKDPKPDRRGPRSGRSGKPADRRDDQPGDASGLSSVPTDDIEHDGRTDRGERDSSGRAELDGNNGQASDRTDNPGRPRSEGNLGERQPGKLGGKSYNSIEEELANTSEAELDSMLDDVFGKEEPATPPPVKQPKQTAKTNPGKAAKKVAIESLSGVKDAVKGLSALFTPKNTLGSGPVFNQETYESAKPHFEKALAHAKEAGFNVKELIKYLADQFDAAIRPYLKQFLMDQQAQGKELPPEKKEKPSQKKPSEKLSEKIKDTDTQTVYKSASKASLIGTLTPANMSNSMGKALAKIEKEHGDIDQFVANKLGYTEQEIIGTKDKFGYFSGEQVDAIALAITNIDNGAGFIIGDQTGVGKGRVVAAMIRYSIKKGLTPIFVTEKPNLYADMYRDLSDIGMSDMDTKILMTNADEKIPLNENGSKQLKTKSNHNNILRRAADEGMLPGEYQAIFTTYDQMNQAVSVRRDFLNALSKGSMMILDEAHNAGGTEGAQAKGDKYPRSIFFRNLVRQASSVFYSSATYAKRPGVMDLYSKTDMRLAVQDPSKIGDAISAGGVPLQQVVAAMLTEAGQYVRRERSFKGITYETKTTEIDNDLTDRAAKAFSEIRYFSEIFAEPLIAELANEGATSGTGFQTGSAAEENKLTSVGFSSVMHNLVNQMLLSMKTQGAVDEAIRAFKEDGKKPVITLSNTMGSFIADYAKINNLIPGDGIGIKFNDLVLEYLYKTRRYSEKDPFHKGKTIKHYIEDADMPKEALREFERIKKFIKGVDMGGIPVSPVDYIKAKLQEAGMTVDELTGRSDIIEYEADGTQRFGRRPESAKSIKSRLGVINGFNKDTIDALILNRSGSTGLSLHSLPKFEGHKPAPRHMIVLQAEANIDTHMQMLGRVNRAGQVNAPSYVQLVGDTPAEMRPASILAGKMASLNANTTASTESEVTAKGTLNFMNKYGDQVIAGLMADFPDWHRSLGSPLPTDTNGYKTEGAARKVTGKIPMLPRKDQDQLYEMIESEYRDLIEQLDAMGENDLEAKTFDTDAKVLKKATVFESEGSSPFQAKAQAEVVDMKKLGKSYTSQQVRVLLNEEVYGKGAEEKPLDRLVKDGMERTLKRFRETLERFEEYKTDVLDNIEKEDRREAQEGKLDTLRKDWQGVALKIYPGRTVQVLLGELFYPATVLSVEQSGKPKNPLALGTWKVTMAVADSSRRITYSFGKLIEANVHEVGWKAVGQIDEESIEQFDRASQDAREDRTIITGNMLAAYSQYQKGRIINYTTDSGNLKQGILMPRGFDLDKANKERPAIVTNVDKVMQVLDENLFMKTTDDLVISKTNDGRFAISVPGSKAKGSKYFLNGPILNAINGDFVKAGNRMKAVTSDRNRAKKVVEYVLKEMNETFMNTADAGKIRRLLGMENEVLRDVLNTKDTPQGGAQFQTTDKSTPTAPSQPPVTLSQIKKWFPGQTVGLNPDGSTWVRLQNGAGLIIRNVKQVAEGKYLVSTESGKMDQNGIIAGKYVNNEIELVDGVADGKTLSHEVTHWLEDIGVITALDKSVMDVKIKALAGKNKLGFNLVQDQRENRANFLAHYLAEREQFRGTPVGRFLQKVADFLDGVLHIGRVSVRKVARGIESGDIFSREAQGGKKGEVQYSTASEEEKANNAFSVPDNSTITEDIKYNIINLLSPIDKVYNAIKKEIPERADFKLAEELRTSKAKQGIDSAEEKYFNPIKKRIGLSKLKVAHVDEFLYSRHAPEANARLRLTNAKYYLKKLADAQKGGDLKKRLDTLDSQFELMEFPTQEIQESYKILLERELAKAETQKELKVKDDWETFSAKPSGMTDKEAEILQEKWKKHMAMKVIARIFDQMNADGLDISHKAGRLSDEGYAAVKGTFNYYAPLLREGHENKRAFSGIGSGIKNLGTDVKIRGGSTKRAVHLLANAFVAHEKIIINAKKAEVAKAFLEFVKQNPNKDFWDFEESKTKAEYDAKGNIKRVPNRNIEPHEVSIKVDGKLYTISVNPNNIHAMRILDIIQGSLNQSGPIVDALSKINRVLASVNTTLNPEFIISNLARDLQTAAINLSDTEVASMRTQILKNIPSAMKGLHSSTRGDGSHEWAEVAKRYEASGAKIGWIDYGKNIETKVKNLESQIDLFREGHIAKKAMDKLFSAIEDYNSIVENAVRLSTFKAGIDAGMSEAKAAIMAKGLTVNFNQKGAYGPVINSLYLFANAGLQGSTRIITALKNSKQARLIVAGSVVAAIGMAFANSGMGGDDDDGIPYYDKIDTYLKARNMIFMIPGSKGDYIKIPLPWGYNVFWALGTEIGDSFVTKGYNRLEGVSRLLSTALDAFNPLQSATLLQTLSPTIGDPFVQVGENKTFFGSPLMPEGNSFDKTPMPDSEKYWKSVRPFSKLIASTLNTATLGDKIKPGLIDISPETLDLVFDTFTGGAGRFLMDTAGLPVKILNGELSPSNTPGLRRIYGSKSEYKEANDYQENLTHIYQLVEQIKTYPEKAEALYKNNNLSKGKISKLYFKARNYEKELKKLNKRLKLSKDKEQQEVIKEKMTKMKQTFNKMFLNNTQK